jgi:hypothetical protein
MDDEATSETPIVEGRTVVTAETVVRSPSERPGHDSINGVANWMIGRGQRLLRRRHRVHGGVGDSFECRKRKDC